MANTLTDRLRAFAHRKLETADKQRPVVRQALNLVGVVNDLLGQPIRAVAEPAAPAPGGGGVATAAPKRPAPLQAPVRVYFDGKDHRTKAKVEELLRSRQMGGFGALTQLDLDGQLTRRVFGPF